MGSSGESAKARSCVPPERPFSALASKSRTTSWPFANILLQLCMAQRMMKKHKDSKHPLGFLKHHPQFRQLQKLVRRSALAADSAVCFCSARCRS